MERASSLISSPPRVIHGITLKFPAKLWRIINRCISGAVSWNSSGTAIVIRRELFEDEFLSVNGHFKTTNFASFVRQLNIYGFRKLITRQRWYERDSIFEYYHPWFQRGHPELLPNVVRNAKKGAARDMVRTSEDLQQPATSSRLNKVIFIEDVRKRTLPSPEEASSDSYDLNHPLLTSKFSGRIKLNPEKYGDQPVSKSDMPRISPTRLHEQVAGVVPSMDASDEDINDNSRSFPDYTECKTETVYVKIENQDMNDYPTSFSQQENHQAVVPDLFHLPIYKNFKDASTKSPDLNLLSESSSDTGSPKPMELMFSSILPQDDQDTDCLTKTFRDSFEVNAHDDTNPELIGSLHSSNSIGTMLMPTDSGDLDNYPFPLGDTLLEYNEDDMGVFTPAYFNPSTGMVTLLLPNATGDN